MIGFRVAVLALIASIIPAGVSHAQEDYVARSLAAYAALDSYSDTAVVETELQLGGGPAIRERHTFATRFRKTRHFYFDFNEDPAAGGDRFVIWSDDEAFYTWWKTTGVKETYGVGRGVAALTSAFGVTSQAAIVTPVLFPQAGLTGPLLNFTEGTFEATEMVGERSCHRVKGVQRSVYATGRGDQARDTTLWIDAETFLLCKTFEDTPEGALAGSANRVTTTFVAQPNPDLADDQFTFAEPED